MTLHDQVRDPRSAVRQVLAAHTTNVEEFRDAVAALCGTDPVSPSSEPVPWSALGHAHSVRLCWELRCGAPEPMARVAAAIGGAAPAIVAALDRQPGELGEDTASRVSWWAGQIDRLSRHCPPDDPDRATLAKHDGLEDVLDATPEPWVADIAAVVERNRRALGLCVGVVTVAPTFAGSDLIGGADGDLIVGSVLVEIKATVAKRPRLRDVHQLLGYVLLDFDDEHRLDHVAYWSARFGAFHAVPVIHLVSDLVEARAELRVALADFGWLDPDTAEIYRQAGFDPSTMRPSDE